MPSDAMIRELWSDLLEKDDRTSPEEYPDMALITFDEFRDYLTAALAQGPVEAEPVAWAPRGHIGRYLRGKGKYSAAWVYAHPTGPDSEPLFASPPEELERVTRERDEARAKLERLSKDDEPMACEMGEMTAAEDVLAWLIVEKIGVPDDVPYTPHQAQKIIEAALDRAESAESQLAEARAQLAALSREGWR